MNIRVIVPSLFLVSSLASLAVLGSRGGKPDTSGKGLHMSFATPPAEIAAF